MGVHSQVPLVEKNLPANAEEIQVRSLDWEDPLGRTWQPTPVFLPGESPNRGAWRATVHRVILSYMVEAT